MKQFIYPCIPFILVALFILLLTNCSSNGSVGDQIKISKIEIEGHTYLIRERLLFNVGFGGMCHDENCECKNSDKQHQD